jgi:hypothetical protein
VRQHRLADDVANRIDGGFAGLAARVDRDEPALVYLDLRAIETGDRRVRPPPDRHQNAIERSLLRARARRRAFEGHGDAVLRLLHRDDLGVEQHRLAHALDPLGENVHEVAVGTGQQAAGHLDDRDLGAERRIHRSQLETDVAAADDEQ